jgi:hypothetical protein
MGLVRKDFVAAVLWLAVVVLVVVLVVVAVFADHMYDHLCPVGIYK